MDIVNFFEVLYQDREEYALLTDMGGNLVWKNRDELPEAFTRKSYAELISDGIGKRSLNYGGESYSYSVTYIDLYALVEFSGKSTLLELISNPVFAQQLIDFDAEKRNAVFGISNSINELFSSLAKSEFYAETDRLDAAGRSCYDIMRVNSVLFEMLKLSRDNVTVGRIDVERAVEDFEWASSAVIRLTPIRISVFSESELYIKTDIRCLNTCLIGMLKLLIRKYPNCSDYRISAKASGEHISISLGTDLSGAESPLSSDMMRTDMLSDHSCSAEEERAYIHLFCDKFGGRLVEYFSEEKGTLILNMPVCGEDVPELVFSSVRTEFRAQSRYSAFHVGLSELCRVKYF